MLTLGSAGMSAVTWVTGGAQDFIPEGLKTSCKARQPLLLNGLNEFRQQGPLRDALRRYFTAALNFSRYLPTALAFAFSSRALAWHSCETMARRIRQVFVQSGFGPVPAQSFLSFGRLEGHRKLLPRDSFCATAETCAAGRKHTLGLPETLTDPKPL